MYQKEMGKQKKKQKNKQKLKLLSDSTQTQTRQNSIRITVLSILQLHNLHAKLDFKQSTKCNDTNHAIIVIRENHQITLVLQNTIIL